MVSGNPFYLYYDLPSYLWSIYLSYAIPLDLKGLYLFLQELSNFIALIVQVLKTWWKLFSEVIWKNSRKYHWIINKFVSQNIQVITFLCEFFDSHYVIMRYATESSNDPFNRVVFYINLSINGLNYSYALKRAYSEPFVINPYFETNISRVSCQLLKMWHRVRRELLCLKEYYLLIILQ